MKEQERLVAKAEADMAERSVKEEGILVIRGASVFGFDTWYGKRTVTFALLLLGRIRWWLLFIMKATLLSVRLVRK